ncbi:caspase family protein [Actinospica durhamensis]|uniref:Caspase family protein n=1 Tax=Actinospica durhamensis TaxID=1508375 RepID=A0A941IW08_9ACTN|nr:caspase family protein [Actinospica durhamensis]MBR7838181.1 caspase family protein [Actinospica durhamensis]
MDRDLSRSRAILIGNARYSEHPRIPDLPAARGSVTAMAELLTSELCGWPAERVTTLVDVAAPHELARRVLAEVREAQDVLLVYYVGHGMRTLDGQLALALGDTDPHPEALPHTAMLYDNLTKIMRGCRAATKLVILDCCHAELGNRANYVFQSADIAEVYPVDGLYYIGASARDKKAKAPLTGEPTYFTQALLDVVHAGIPRLPATLRLDQIFLEMRGRLLRASLPEPVEAGTRGARQYPFARNAAGLEEPPSADHPKETAGARLSAFTRAKVAVPSLVVVLALAAVLATRPWTGGSTHLSTPPSSPTATHTGVPATTTTPKPAYQQTVGTGCTHTVDAAFEPQPDVPYTAWATVPATGTVPTTTCANNLLYTEPTTKTAPDRWMNYAQWIFSDVPTHEACTFDIYIAPSTYSQYDAKYFWATNEKSGNDDVGNSFKLPQAELHGIWRTQTAGPFPTGKAVLNLVDSRTSGSREPMTASLVTLTCN